MTALVGREVKRNFFILVRYLVALAHVQADQTKGQNAAEGQAALRGRHVAGGEGVGAFHEVSLAVGFS